MWTVEKGTKLKVKDKEVNMEIVKILATIFLILTLFLVGFYEMDDPKKIKNRLGKK